MPEGIRSVLTRATPGSESVRTTVPHSIVLNFGLKIGDELFWQTVAEGDKLKIVVEPVKKGSTSKSKK